MFVNIYYSCKYLQTEKYVFMTIVNANKDIIVKIEIFDILQKVKVLILIPFFL